LSLDLELDDAQRAIADALGQFCTDCCDEATVGAGVRGFPSALWQQLAGLGVLALATPEGDGGACEAVAACEALGRAVFPGPLAATFFATQLLGAADRAAVAEGSVLVSAGAPPLLPLHCSARIRHQQVPQTCTVTAGSLEDCTVRFERPQRAIAPGQSVVFYDNDECLGGGIIEAALPGGSPVH